MSQSNIQKLSKVAQLESSDWLPIARGDSGLKANLEDVVAFVISQIDVLRSWQTYTKFHSYYAEFIFDDIQDNAILYLQDNGSSGTDPIEITLPPNPIDNQEILFVIGPKTFYAVDLFFTPIPIGTSASWGLSDNGVDPSVAGMKLKYNATSGRWWKISAVSLSTFIEE